MASPTALVQQLFTLEDADACVDILPDATIVGKADRKHKWLGLRGRPGVLQGAYEFSVQLQEACLLRVGWATAASSRVIGLDALSFGYGGTAIKSHNRKFEKYGEEYDSCAGAVVVCRVDRRDSQKETISYSLNGRDLGVAFDIPTELAGVPLFPAISGKETWSAVVLGDSQLSCRQAYRPLHEAVSAGHAVAQPFTIGPWQDDADPCVHVQEDVMEVESKAESLKAWYGVRARPGILRGRYQFEVQLQRDCLVRVGWATLKSKRTIGGDARSFGYGGTAKKSHGGKYEDYGEKFGGAGTVVSCLIDRVDPHRQTISYCLDGAELGVAFEIPEALLNEPLYPAVCGKADWHVSFAMSSLAHPVEGYTPAAQALALRDAVVVDVPRSIKPPPGGRRVVSDERFFEILQERRDAPFKFAPQSEIKPGLRVVVYVNSGPWSGWYACHVVDTDPMGCYVKHDIDDHTENIPWSFLGGAKYDIDLMPNVAASSAENTALAFSPALEEELASKQEGEEAALPAATVQPPPPVPVTESASENAAAAASLLRKGSLRVHADLGAGITCVVCDVGYYVSLVELPGQPDLKKGDVIVAIGKSILLGLDEDGMEECFEKEFCEGASVIVAPYIGLRPLPFSAVRRHAEHLLRQSSPLSRTGSSGGA